MVRINLFCLITAFLLFSNAGIVNAQAVDQTWSSNVTLKDSTDFGKGGASDVWGWKDGSTHYALITLGRGLSIIDTDDTTSPEDIVHINGSGSLSVADVETYSSGGNTYAYLAVTDASAQYYVLIIELNEAIGESGDYTITPTGSLDDVFVGRIQNEDQGSWQAHTLTIAGDFLYVATQKNKIAVYDLASSATAPDYEGAITTTTASVASWGVHEMYVKSTGSNSSIIYAATKRDGLQKIVVSNIENLTISSTTQHKYDSDKAYADEYNSTDSDFDYRLTHSAWPTDDGDYIFTTDEIKVHPTHSTKVDTSSDANLYLSGSLYSAHRQGNFLRSWKTADLGTSSSFKGGYDVPQGDETGEATLSNLDNTMKPSSVHQMYATGNVMYVAHYSQGLRVLDIYDPEDLDEVGYYDDYPTLSDSGGHDYFFRKDVGGGTSPWNQGVYGVYPDPNRPGIVYAGSFNVGLYIFDVLTTIATPTGLSASGSVGQNPTISWNASSDVGLDGYNLYRSLAGAAYSLLITLDRNTTSFLDTGVIIGNGKSDPNACYKLSAINITGRESSLTGSACKQYSGLNKSGQESCCDDETQPTEYKLLPAYPNPFNPTTRISYELPENSYVKLLVYNMLGQQIAVLADGYQETGRYNVNFDAKDLPTGTYIYQLTTDTFSDKKKMVLVK